MPVAIRSDVLHTKRDLPVAGNLSHVAPRLTCRARDSRTNVATVTESQRTSLAVECCGKQRQVLSVRVVSRVSRGMGTVSRILGKRKTFTDVRGREETEITLSMSGELQSNVAGKSNYYLYL